MAKCVPCACVLPGRSEGDTAEGPRSSAFEVGRALWKREPSYLEKEDRMSDICQEGKNLNFIRTVCRDEPVLILSF